MPRRPVRTQPQEPAKKIPLVPAVAMTPVPEPATPAAPGFWNRPRTIVAVTALLTLQASLAVSSLVLENPTVDEVIHLPAGISYWQTGRFALYHHNPPLVKLIAALPVLASGVETEPLYHSTYWRSIPPNKAGFAHEFALLNARSYFELFTRARLLMPLFAVLGGLGVFFWSRDLFGTAGGLFSLALWCTCPNILAHCRLITTDAAAASVGLLSTYLFWRFLRGPSWRWAIVAGIALGFAALTKFSLVLLFGLWPLLWLAKVIHDRDFARLPRRVGQGAVIVVLSVLVINLGYGFEGVGKPLGSFAFYSRSLTRDREPVPPGPEMPFDILRETHRLRVNRFKGTFLEALPVPLPAEYLLGFDDQKLEAEGIPLRARDRTAPADAVTGYTVYLDGELSDRSWKDYYLRALLYKVPEGTWFLILASLAVLVLSPRSRRAWPDEMALLAIPVVVVVSMSLFTNIALGLRYVLPILPFLYLGAGRLIPWMQGLSRTRRRSAGIVLGAAFLATAVSTALIHPHYLAYFNWISGGPDRGSEHLIDSNLDWGQDLVGLHRWLREKAPNEKVGIGYFGQIPPAIFEARGEPLDWFLPPALPGGWGDNVPPRYRAKGNHPPAPGLYAVSASLVRGLRWAIYDSYMGEQDQMPVWAWATYQAENNAFSYFSKLTPFKKIGYSIFLYRITPEQAAELATLWTRQRTATSPAPEGR